MSIQKNSVISFRLPNHTPDEVIDFLNDIKKKSEKKKGGFSKEISSLFIESVQNRLKKNQNEIRLPISGELSQEAKEWLNQEQTKKMLGEWVRFLAEQPEKAFSLLSPNSSDSVPTKETQENNKFLVKDEYVKNLLGFFMDE